MKERRQQRLLRNLDQVSKAEQRHVLSDTDLLCRYCAGCFHVPGHQERDSWLSAQPAHCTVRAGRDCLAKGGSTARRCGFGIPQHTQQRCQQGRIVAFISVRLSEEPVMLYACLGASQPIFLGGLAKLHTSCLR